MLRAIGNMKTYHLVDHPGIGTIHKLLIPLCELSEKHIMLTPYEENYKLTSSIMKEINSTKCRVIIHSTGRSDSVYLNEHEKLFPGKKCYIFMHISDKQLLYKNRQITIERLKDFSSKGGMVLTPAKEVSHKFNEYGIISKSIQIGIPHIEEEDKYKRFVPELSPYYNKIVTTCSSDKDDFKYVKGIDRFEDLMIRMNLTHVAIVAGTDNNCGTSLLCHRFNIDDFVNVLYHSIAYVQLARYETYNLSAVQAKRMRCPALILNTEGTPSCMNIDVFDSIDDIGKEIVKILKNGKDLEVIDRQYRDSVVRETLESFLIALEELDVQ